MAATLRCVVCECVGGCISGCAGGRDEWLRMCMCVCCACVAVDVCVQLTECG